MIDCFLGDAFGVLSCCFAVLFCSVPIHTWNYTGTCALSGARFFTGGLFECDIAHRRSVAVQNMLYKIRCNPTRPLNGVLPGPYVPVRVQRGALVAQRYTYAPPCCRDSQYRSTFIPVLMSIWYDLADPVFDGVGLADFKSRTDVFLLA